MKPATTPRLLILLNPAAGRHKTAYLDTLVAALRRRGIHPEIYETRGPGDAQAALPRLLGDFDIVAAAGGDGTVNEVLNGIRGSGVTLGIIPCGTTNVLATELGLPQKAEDIAAVLAGGVTRTIFPGDVNGRRFGMMVGIGYDAWVVEGVDPALKKRLGKLAYVLSMVRELKRFGRHQYQLHIDGSVHTAASVVATLGRHYAGSYVLAREARIDLPELHLVLVQTLSRWAFLLMLLALPLGLAQRLPFMKTVRGRHVRVTPWPDAGTTESLQADGDTVGSLPAVISVEEDPLQVLVPG